MTSCKVVDVGKTHSWDGLARKCRMDCDRNLTSKPATFLSADYMQGTKLTFRSKEDAIHFSEKQGKPSVSIEALIAINAWCH